MKTNALNARLGFVAVLTITVTLATGCQSGGSKWAWWNPMSRSAADTSLVARTAPALPSDSATPLIEGIEAPVATAVASTIAPALPASATATPLASTPPAMPKRTLPPTSSIASATPAQEAAKIRAVPQMSAPAAQPYVAPGKTMTPADAYAAAGPYDPNAYQPTAPAQVKSDAPASTGRYGGLGDRYASVASNTAANTVAEAVPNFSTPAASPASPSTEDRYGMGGRYASASTAASTAATPSATHPAVVGTPPPATSVYSTASAVPTTAPASERSEIRLTSLPGEYRPGGTGTYKSGVSIATRPGSGGSKKATPVNPPRYR